MATTARSAAKPLTPAQRALQQQRQAQLIRVGVLLLLILFFAHPLLPSTIAGYDWRAAVWAQIEQPLMQLFPSAEVVADLPFGITAAPMLNWIYRALALGGIWLILGMVMHVISIYQQRTRPLSHERTYLRMRIPMSITLSPSDAPVLLKTLHGMIPVLPAGAPLVLRWTGRPERRHMQGVSLVGDKAFQISVQRVLESLARGSQVDTVEDPLLAACQAGRVLCWCDVRLSAANALPIAPIGSATPLVETLLSSLTTQQGVFVTDVQIVIRPIRESAWRMPVVARLEASKADSTSAERKALEHKAAGPSYDVTIRLIAVAADPNAGSLILHTMAGSLAASMQSVGDAHQRLVAGPIQVVPAVLEPPTPLPRHLALGLPICALLGGAGGSLLLWQWGIGLVAPQLLAVPFLLAFVPFFAYQTWRFRRQHGQQWQQLHTILRSVPEPRTPNTIPLWSDWFGYRS